MSGDDPVDNPTDGFYAAPGTTAHQRLGLCRRPKTKTASDYSAGHKDFWSLCLLNVKKIKVVAIYPFTICTPCTATTRTGRSSSKGS